MLPPVAGTPRAGGGKQTRAVRAEDEGVSEPAHAFVVRKAQELGEYMFCSRREMGVIISIRIEAPLVVDRIGRFLLLLLRHMDRLLS